MLTAAPCQVVRAVAPRRCVALADKRRSEAAELAACGEGRAAILDQAARGRGPGAGRSSRSGMVVGEHAGANHKLDVSRSCSPGLGGTPRLVPRGGREPRLRSDPKTRRHCSRRTSSHGSSYRVTAPRQPPVRRTIPHLPLDIARVGNYICADGSRTGTHCGKGSQQPSWSSGSSMYRGWRVGSGLLLVLMIMAGCGGGGKPSLNTLRGAADARTLIEDKLLSSAEFGCALLPSANEVLVVVKSRSLVPQVARLVPQVRYGHIRTVVDHNVTSEGYIRRLRSRLTQEAVPGVLVNEESVLTTRQCPRVELDVTRGLRVTAAQRRFIVNAVRAFGDAVVLVRSAVDSPAGAPSARRLR